MEHGMNEEQVESLMQELDKLQEGINGYGDIRCLVRDFMVQSYQQGLKEGKERVIEEFRKIALEYKKQCLTDEFINGKFHGIIDAIEELKQQD